MYKKFFFSISRICVIYFFVLSINSCKTKKSIDPIPENNTVIIDLKESVNPDQIINDFSTISLSKVKKLSNALNIYLFSYDTTKIGIEDLIEKLKESEKIDNAQSNKKTNTRN